MCDIFIWKFKQTWPDEPTLLFKQKVQGVPHIWSDFSKLKKSTNSQNPVFALKQYGLQLQY